MNKLNNIQIQSPKIIQNQNDIFHSPRNINVNVKKSYEQYSACRSPQEQLIKKVSSAHLSNSDKKVSINISQDYTTDRKNIINKYQQQI